MHNYVFSCICVCVCVCIPIHIIKKDHSSRFTLFLLPPKPHIFLFCQFSDSLLIERKFKYSIG